MGRKGKDHAGSKEGEGGQEGWREGRGEEQEISTNLLSVRRLSLGKDSHSLLQADPAHIKNT